MTIPRLFMALVGLALVSACGGDDETPEPVRKCQNFVNVYCDKAIDCAVGAGLVTSANANTEKSSCRSGANQTISCNKAAAVTASYDQCISDIGAADCGPVIAAIQAGDSPLPAACMGVILINQ